MSQVLVRNLDPALVEKLKARAGGNNRSLQAELKSILEETARSEHRDFTALAAQIRRKLANRTHSDSAVLLGP